MKIKLLKPLPVSMVTILKKKEICSIEIGKANATFAFFLQNDSLKIAIPFDEIEAIVFKDNYESYRSPNYSRPQVDGGIKYLV